jgi:hypothetical protein
MEILSDFENKKSQHYNWKFGSIKSLLAEWGGSTQNGSLFWKEANSLPLLLQTLPCEDLGYGSWVRHQLHNKVRHQLHNKGRTWWEPPFYCNQDTRTEGQTSVEWLRKDRHSQRDRAVCRTSRAQVPAMFDRGGLPAAGQVGHGCSELFVHLACSVRRWERSKQRHTKWCHWWLRSELDLCPATLPLPPSSLFRTVETLNLASMRKKRQAKEAGWKSKCER